MTNKLYLLLLSIILSMSLTQAQVAKTVNVATPGTLGTLLGSDLKTVTDLSTKLSITTYEPESFNGYSGHVILPLNTEVVGDNVFAGFKGSVVLPEGLKKIGTRSFFVMHPLKES